MTTPIQPQQPPFAATPAHCTKVPHGWVCSRPAGHDGPCEASPIDGTAPPVGDASPSAQQTAGAVSTPRAYGFTKPDEFDLELPSGSFVRLRKLSKNQILTLNLVEVLDGFTPELLEAARSGEQISDEDAAKVLADPNRNTKIFGPVDRVVAAACVKPVVVLDGPTLPDASQYNVGDVDLEDKLAIFSAAFGEQLAALKSVRTQQGAGVRDLPESESIQQVAE